MRGGAAFSDILQEKLDVHVRDAAPAPMPAGFAVPPPLGFFFDPGPRPAFYSRGNARRWQAPRPPRPRRTLLPHEQRALDYLVGLGARLEPDFTNTELRTAFRALAREYHPDRHPGSSSQERDRLSVLFGRLRHAYDQLLHAN